MPAPVGSGPAGDSNATGVRAFRVTFVSPGDAYDVLATDRGTAVEQATAVRVARGIATPALENVVVDDLPMADAAALAARPHRVRCHPAPPRRLRGYGRTATPR